jgi:polar amino acid transport system substrate-binding protein
MPIHIRHLVLILMVLATACDATPRDPEGTLERVSGGTLRVGVTASDPWVVLEGEEPSGVEVSLVEGFAAEINAQIEWIHGSEEEIFGALKHGEIDLVIGGLSSRSPFAVEAALTHPYLTTQVVVAVPEGDRPPGDIAGIEVAAEAGTEGAGILAKTDAEVILVEDIAEVDGPRAIDDYLVDDLGLEETGDTLTETDHVMAVRMGENGFMVTLERYLLENSEMVHEILDEEAKP